MIDTIIQGDCLDVMKDIPDKSIDMILCDLPYGMTACKWDVRIPFEPLWMAYKRINKDNGAIVLTTSQPFTSMLVMSNLEMFKYEWIWDKVRPFGFLDSKIRPMKKHENILVFSKAGCSNGSNPIMKYNPQDLVYKETTSSHSKSKILHSEPKQSKNTVFYTNYPDTILTIKPDTSEGHPTQKPVALFEYLIKTYTNEGDLVLDNCIGSGTTAVACVNLNRHFIGIELSQEYCEIARKRVEKTKLIKYSQPELQLAGG